MHLILVLSRKFREDMGSKCKRRRSHEDDETTTLSGNRLLQSAQEGQQIAVSVTELNAGMYVAEIVQGTQVLRHKISIVK